ncbi:MAG TPA: hypothetical protein VFG25_04525 [Nitrosopumilaceae archaeon]|nr:hypothetical protein [Nitrosopumilaceae archaeon]
MVKLKPVSIKRQTIFALIPSIDIWAFYRIQKLRKFILIVLSLGFAFAPISLSVSASIDMSTVTSPLDLYTNPIFLLYVISSIGTLHVTLVYFIRKWSKEWNEKVQRLNVA